MPIGVRFGPTRLYLVNNAQDNITLFKNSNVLTSKPGVMLAMNNLFRSPKHNQALYQNDNSGSMAKPLPGSNVEPNKRIFHLQHHNSTKYLTGANLNQMTERFISILATRLGKKDIGDEWIELPDLHRFMQIELGHATVKALCGEKIFEVDPDFVEHFWEYDSHAGTLLKGFPRWLTPAAYKALDVVHSSIMKWHALARENASAELENEHLDWEPYWGAKFMRVRQNYGTNTGLLGLDGVASEDLGLIFA